MFWCAFIGLLSCLDQWKKLTEVCQGLHETPCVSCLLRITTERLKRKGKQNWSRRSSGPHETKYVQYHYGK